MTLNDFLLGSKAGLTPAEATAALPHLLTQQQAATDALQSATAEVQAAQAKVDDDSAHSQFLRTRLNDTTKALSAFDSTLSDELNALGESFDFDGQLERRHKLALKREFLLARLDQHGSYTAQLDSVLLCEAVATQRQAEVLLLNAMIERTRVELWASLGPATEAGGGALSIVSPREQALLQEVSDAQFRAQNARNSAIAARREFSAQQLSGLRRFINRGG
jgi:hypothetical protein